MIGWCGVGIVFLLHNLLPTSFNTLFLINVWLFSLPHTFSTFTRSDRRSRKEIFLTLGLMLSFFIATMFVARTSGLVVLYSLYFYWQQFHYGKQNFGVAAWESKGALNGLDQLFYLSIVGLSLMGLLSDGTQSFFGYALWFPYQLHVSKITLFACMMIMTLAYVKVRPAQVKSAFGHVLIFSFAYLNCEHFALGWLLLNVFHNLQYLSFMKSFERRLSYIWIPCALTLILYLTQFHLLSGLIFFSLPFSLTVMMSLNFTHYALDGLIWKRPKVSF